MDKKHRKCIFYIENQDLEDGDSKIFQCDCDRHRGKDISIVNVDGTIKEIQLSDDLPNKTEYEPETFEHLLTNLMIMFGDARDMENRQFGDSEKKIKEARNYAKSWLEEHDEIHTDRIKYLLSLGIEEVNCGDK